MEKLESKKRKIKTTPTQFNLYLEMLESNEYFRENKMTPDNRDELKNAWDKLVQQLNSSGGPQRSIAEWKRVFIDWKSQVRKRARICKQSVIETGNKGEPEKELTELEKKLIYLTGEIVIEGIKGVPEIGIDNEVEINKAIDEEKIEQEKKEKTFLKVSSINEKKILYEINSNLKKLVELKEEELDIKKKKFEFNQAKFQVKYDVELVKSNNIENE